MNKAGLILSVAAAMAFVTGCASNGYGVPTDSTCCASKCCPQPCCKGTCHCKSSCNSCKGDY